MVGAADEIQHRQQRLARQPARTSNSSCVLGQHRLPGVDHIMLRRRWRAVAAALWLPVRSVAAPRCPQGSGPGAPDRRGVRQVVLKALEVQSSRAMASSRPGVSYSSSSASPSTDRRRAPFDMPGGARAMGHFAEADVAGQGTQQRGLADIGVADHGQLQRGFMGSVMAGLQPVQGHAVGEGHRATRCSAVCQSPRRSASSASPGGACNSQTRVALALRASSAISARLPRSGERRGSQAHGQACRRKARQLFEEFVARLAAVENAGAFHGFGQLGRPGPAVQLDCHQQCAVASLLH